MLCMYCGKCDPSLTLSGLEDHYKTKCLMLTACPSCSEVIETRYLADHFLYECAKRSEYIQCDRCQVGTLKHKLVTNIKLKFIIVTNLHNTLYKAQIVAQMQKYIFGWDFCTFGFLVTSETIGRCLLCWGDVKTNNDIGWRKHLMQECKANSRKAN